MRAANMQPGSKNLLSADLTLQHLVFQLPRPVKAAAVKASEISCSVFVAQPVRANWICYWLSQSILKHTHY